MISDPADHDEAIGVITIAEMRTPETGTDSLRWRRTRCRHPD
jgi:hypothetical protein